MGYFELVLFSFSIILDQGYDVEKKKMIVFVLFKICFLDMFCLRYVLVRYVFQKEMIRVKIIFIIFLF